MEPQYQLKTGAAKAKWWILSLVTIGFIGIVLALIWLNLRPRRPIMQEEYSISSNMLAESISSQASSKTDKIYVDLKGAVKNPGVYELRAGARVHEAIQKAGGLTADAEAKSINQAQKLTDEAVIYVAKIGEEGADVTQTGQHQAGASDSAGSSGGKSDKVNLNTATEAELQTISGIGQKRASDIIAYRESAGRFKSVDELKKVSGIGDKTLEKLKEYVTVD